MENGTQGTQSRPLLPSIPHAIFLSVLVVVLVPMANWLRMLVDFRRPLTLSEELAVALVLRWSLVGLTWFGTAVRGHGLRELLGRTWQSVQDVRNDFRFASILGLFLLLSTFFANLLGPFRTPTADASRRTSIELILPFSVRLAVSAGIIEELIFRGYLLRQFRVLARIDEIGLVSQAIVFVGAW